MPKPASAESFLPLKPNWFHVLLALADEEQHGYGIMQEVLARTGGKVHLWPATLYGTLKRLIDEELIEESGERPTPELDDARRRYYRLTRLGRRVLAAESERLEDLVRAVHAKRGVARRRAQS
ncbi:MAG TPA: helix-turn-helix transcriptional regulator [Bryobacteraceae bacterium]|nr:helix-turn-helix transcriptional regulator [Bryobacteraceae bacterium]